MYPWNHWRTLVPLVLGFAGLLGFIAWEIYGAKEPLITLRVFMNRTATASYIGTVMHGIIVRPPFVLWDILLTNDATTALGNPLLPPALF